MTSREKCCICLEYIPKTYPKTTCGHLIHYKCLRQYGRSLRSKKTISCPLCRTNILIYPTTRSENQWKHYYQKIALILDHIKASNNKLQNTLHMIKAFEYVWESRITIRRQEHLTNIIKNKINQIDFDFLQTNTSKKQYKSICEIVNNIRRL